MIKKSTLHFKNQNFNFEMSKQNCYIFQDKDLSVNGDDGDDEDFVDGDESDQESSEEEEDSEDEPVQLGKSRYGRSRAKPGRLRS